MKEEKINIFELPWKNSDEKDVFLDIIARSGYKKKVCASVTVEKGMTVEMTVNIHYSGISQHSLEEFTRQFADLNGKTIQFEQCMKKKRFQDGIRFIWGFLSLCNGKAYEQGCNKKEHKVTKNSPQIQRTFFQKLNEKRQTDINVYGKILVTGNSFVPRKAKIFIQIMQIKSKYGKRMTFFSNNHTVIDEQGEKCLTQCGNLMIL